MAKKWRASEARKLKDNLKPSGTLTQFQKALFIALDGEGAEVNGKHEYILFGCTNERISNPHGLGTSDCLDLLTTIHDRIHDARAIYTMFGMGYDVNMMLRDVPKDDIAELWNGQSITYRDYQIQYRPRKELIIQKYGADKWQQDSGGKWHAHASHTIHIWDVWGFFQSSLVAAIESWLPQFDRGILNTIKTNKLARSTFQPDMLPEMESYMLHELHALESLMHRVQNALDVAGIPITRWDGAGSIAATILKQHAVKPHMQNIPATIENLAQYAYAGGRIELCQYGHCTEPVYGYDINSAYPSAMLDMPSLAEGEWIRTKTFQPESFGIWHIEYHGDESAPIHPLFWRDTDKRIYYPCECEGWYYTPEVCNALDHARILDGYVFKPSTDTKPFSFVADLYRIRAQWKAEGNDAHKMLKLGLNSLYGKLAQQVGHHGKPPYHNLVYAGWITSITRARLYHAAMQSPESIIFLATDGILSTQPLQVPCGTELGQWTYTEYTGCTTVQAGVYWLHCDEGTVNHYRGFNRDSLHLDDILDTWREGKRSYAASSTRFIGMGSALVGKRWSQWRTWRTIDRSLRLDPSGTKRCTHPDAANITRKHNPSMHLYRTLPQPILYKLSTPFPLSWVAPTVDGVSESVYDTEVEESSI